MSKNKIFVLGGSGFIGGAIADGLSRRGFSVEKISSKELDLCDEQSIPKLRRIFSPDAKVVFASAKAPVKNTAMLLDNIKMADNFCRAYSESSGIKYLLYVSSDAVFADSNELISESYFKAPDSLHGVMHLAREICFSNLGVGLGVIRPTLVYGPGDPHNGYGPNKFMRLVNEGKDVVLFGKGEERRDHIFIGDVAEIAVRMVEGNICESFNAVSGEVISFADVAKRVVTYRQSSVRIIETGRNGPMPHGGYRAFDNRKIFQFFPDIKISKFDDSLFS